MTLLRSSGIVTSAVLCEITSIILLKYWPVQTDVASVHSITFDTSRDCRMVQDFEQLPVLLFAGRVNGGGESVNLLLTRVVEFSVPTEGYNHAIHHISVGEVTAGWSTMWHMAKGRTAWYLKGILKICCEVIHQASQSRVFSHQRGVLSVRKSALALGTNKAFTIRFIRLMHLLVRFILSVLAHMQGNKIKRNR